MPHTALAVQFSASITTSFSCPAAAGQAGSGRRPQLAQALLGAASGRRFRGVGLQPRLLRRCRGADEQAWRLCAALFYRLLAETATAAAAAASKDLWRCSAGDCWLSGGTWSTWPPFTLLSCHSDLHFHEVRQPKKRPVSASKHSRSRVHLGRHSSAPPGFLVHLHGLCTPLCLRCGRSRSPESHDEGLGLLCWLAPAVLLCIATSSIT